MPVHRTVGGLAEYAIDTKKLLRDMARYGQIYGLTKEEHTIVVKANDDGVTELSGRKCADEVDLAHSTMVESISSDFANLSFDGAYQQLKFLDNLYIKMANRHPYMERARRDRNLGPIAMPLTGMT